MVGSWEGPSRFAVMSCVANVFNHLGLAIEDETRNAACLLLTSMGQLQGCTRKKGANISCYRWAKRKMGIL